MHFQGLSGAPRRYYSFERYDYMTAIQSAQVWVSLIAFVLGTAQLIFFVNFFYSVWRGTRSERNPWNAATLEWTAESPPPHGNWGEQAPEVHRWPYDYSLPGAASDCLPETAPAMPSEGSLT